VANLGRDPRRRAARQKLSDLPPGPDLILEGDGDIWHFTDTPKHGKRSFEYDAGSDLFTDESYDAIRFPITLTASRSE